MKDVNDIKLEIINGQLIALALFIITLLVSILLAYNEKLNLENKTPLFNNEKSLEISIINRLVVVILGAYFIYTSVVNKNLDNSDNIQVFSSILAFLASLVGLYSLIRSYILLKENANTYDFSI